MKRKSLFIQVMIASALLLMAASAFAQSGPEYVVMSFSNLAPLDEAESHYEGWAIVDGSPVSTGNFNINDEGLPVELGGGGVIDEFMADQSIVEASDIKITIEPAGDADPSPSGLVIVGGAVSSYAAMLATEVPGLEMLEDDATGSYILATPSDNDEDETNNDQGIWYLQVPGPTPGFENLPDIGPNWVYEGWVVDVSGSGPVPYSTGTFAMAAQEDSDAAGCNGGGPPFPGQDFVAFQCPPVLDLDSGDFAAVISIEPVPDTGPGPFQLKPFAGGIPTDALDGNNPVGNQTAATFPSGMAQLMAPVGVEETTWGDLKASYR